MDKELHEIMDDSIVAQKLLEHRVVNKTLDRTIEKTIHDLCYKVDLSHAPSVIRLVERIRFLKYELPRGFQSMISEGELYFEENKEELRKSEAETG